LQREQIPDSTEHRAQIRAEIRTSLRGVAVDSKKSQRRQIRGTESWYLSFVLSLYLPLSNIIGGESNISIAIGKATSSLNAFEL